MASSHISHDQIFTWFTRHIDQILHNSSNDRPPAPSQHTSPSLRPPFLEHYPILTPSASVFRESSAVLLAVAAHVVELLEAPLLGHFLRWLAGS